MSDELRLVGSVGLSLLASLALVPLVIRLAVRTNFLDLPAGYKGHRRATPYLGGLAVVASIGITTLAMGVVTSRFAPVLIWGFVLFVVGTIDDRRNLNPGVRLVIEIFAGAALWHYGLGWGILPWDVANAALTVFWVVGLVNAFNLMDNMDGAASTVAGISATGVALMAILSGNVELAVLVLAVAGACVGFLRYNLAGPARIFLGDGGSMPIGFVVAAAVMATPANGDLGWAGLFAAVPVVGLPILDTTLVVISRRRGGRAVLAGGRDHLTHRLRTVVGTPRAVAGWLAAGQSMLCLTAVLLTETGTLPLVMAAGAYLTAGCFAVYRLESRIPPDTSFAAVPAKASVAAHSAHATPVARGSLAA